MLDFTLMLIGTSVLCAVTVYLAFERKWGRRVQSLEQDLQRLSETMSQMAEIQIKLHQKVSDNLGDIEEKILDLAAPSRGSDVPLDRRHHVITLARKGVGLDEIVKRLNIPRGEAELILSLRKYMDTAIPRASQASGESKYYA